MPEKIEYETVTVKVPKLVIDFYRKTEDDPIEALEYSIVDSTRALIEGMEGETWVDIFKLKSVSYELLDARATLFCIDKLPVAFMRVLEEHGLTVSSIGGIIAINWLESVHTTKRRHSYI